MITRRPRLLAAIAVALPLTLSACADEAPTQTEFNDAMEGITTDPTTYELTVVSCVNDGEGVYYTWGITNLTDERKTYAFDPYLTNSEGQEVKMLRELVAESVGPSNYVEWDSFAGGGERFPLGDVECRFEVVDSVLGQFRDEG